MAIIPTKTKKGERRYKVRVRGPNQKWFPQCTCRTLAEAKRAEADLRALSVRHSSQEELEALRHPLAKSSLKFADLVAMWTSECRTNISEGWRISQDQIIRDYFSPIMDMAVSDVSPRDISKLLSRAQTLRSLKAESMAKIYHLLNRIFTDAAEHFELDIRNPVLKKFRPEVIKTESAYLTPDQSWRLIECARGHWAYLTISISLLEGLRISEAQALKVGAIDLNNNQILISSAYNRKTGKIQPYPKQRSWGRVPIAAPLKDDLIKAIQAKNPTDFVCEGPNGGMVNHSSFTRALKSLCKKADLPLMNPHGLRHSCTELYVSAGASAEDIRRLLNHSSVSTTMRYIHRTDDRLAGFAGKLAAKNSFS